MVDIKEKSMDKLTHGEQWEMDLYERAVEVFGDEAVVLKTAQKLNGAAQALTQLGIGWIWGDDDLETLEKLAKYAMADANIWLNILGLVVEQDPDMELGWLRFLEGHLNKLARVEEEESR